MGNNLKNWRKKFNNYLDEKKIRRTVFEYLIALFGAVISALLISFSFRSFLSPNVANATVIITGGTSGIARTIALIVDMFINNPDKVYLIYSIVYFVINIPIIYLAFRFISFRFGLFTALNVALVTVFTSFINLQFIDDLAKSVACIISDGHGNYLQAGMLARALFAALCSGVSTCIAFASGSSAGGADTISYFFALRKSTNVGKYLLTINSATIGIYSIVYFIDLCQDGGYQSIYLAKTIGVIFFAITYLLVLSLTIDTINRRNKKEQIQIITKDENLPKLLLANIPHGATIMRAKGAFTGEDQIVIYIIVSIYETKGVVDLVKSVDPKSFVNITSVKQVYGRFFIKPIK